MKCDVLEIQGNSADLVRWICSEDINASNDGDCQHRARRRHELKMADGRQKIEEVKEFCI